MWGDRIPNPKKDCNPNSGVTGMKKIEDKAAKWRHMPHRTRKPWGKGRKSPKRWKKAKNDNVGAGTKEGSTQSALREKGVGLPCIAGAR